MTGGWAALASATRAPIKAATPYPRDLTPGVAPSVNWTIGTSAERQISAQPWTGTGGESAAMQVPAFSQGVSIISGTCGAMPLWVHRGDFSPLPTPQVIWSPDPDVPASVTWTRVYRDLVLHPFAWMLVTQRRADGFPQSMRHVPYFDVSVAQDGIYIEGRKADDRDVKRFDSPHAPGALHNGAGILRTASLIEGAVRRFATFDIPAGWLKQTGGPDLTDDEIDALLSGWEGARQTRSTAYLSQSLEYGNNSFDAKQLQLVEARAAITQDVARLLNLPPSAVNAETGSSLTYSTVAQQAEALQAQTLWPYLSAVRGRLSMGDITPRGTSVEVPSLGFLRTDIKARADAYAVMISNGVMTAEEARRLEQLPPLPLPTDETGNVLP